MFIIQGCDIHIPSVDDAVIKDDERFYIGEGEVCENAEYREQCKDGLFCKRVVNEPYIIGICYQRDYTLDNNITYIERYSAQIN